MKTSLLRMAAVTGAIAAAVTTTLVALPAWAQADKPLRIGFSMARTGPLANATVSQSNTYELWREHPDTRNRHVFADSTRGEPLAKAVSHEFDVPNGRWSLSIAPRAGWTDATRIAGSAGLVLALALAAAALAWVIARQPEVLELTVAARTTEIGNALMLLEGTNVLLEREIRQHTQTQEELAASNERFRNLVEATSDWV